jgi:hypothetical protein
MGRERQVSASDGSTAKFAKVGDEVGGLYIGKQYDANGKWGPVHKHLLKSPKGVTVVYAKVDSRLDRLFEGDRYLGRYIWVVFVGTKPNPQGGNDQKLYAIDMDPDVERVPADELPTFAADAEDEEDDNQVGEEPTQSYDRPTRKTPDKANVEALLARNKRN